MDLTSDHPFWFVKNGLLSTYPAIEEDCRCEVAVLGAGISGAIIADRLTRDGYTVVVLDRRDACLGSTSASTALLQYEIDIPLVELERKIGIEAARRAYVLSHQSIDSVAQLARGLEYECGFEPTTSIYLASDTKSAGLLRREATARRELGLDAMLLETSEIRERFSLAGTAAIVSKQAAAVDPYRFAHGLLGRAARGGAKIFDRTEVENIEQVAGKIQLQTNRSAIVWAERVVIATGYEALNLLREPVAKLKSTYAVVSQPLKDISPWNREWMLWEAKDPYLYLRVTDDNRLLVGGEDDEFRSPSRRDRSLSTKVERIRSKVQKLLPDLCWEVEFAWAGTFGETEDGLAYIGESSEYPNCYFALGFGGNGITFSIIASNLIADLIAGRNNTDLRLFRFNR